MKARFAGSWGIASRANLALALTLLATESALAAQATPEQKKACTPDVYHGRNCGRIRPSIARSNLRQAIVLSCVPAMIERLDQAGAA